MPATRKEVKTVWLALDYACNNRCQGCYAASSTFKSEPMAMEYALKVLGFAKALGARDCLMIGGEPTLYRNLSELMRQARPLGLEFKLVTNGRRLVALDYLTELKDAGLNHVSISVEGARPETHNRISNSSSFHQVMRAIENCAKLRMNFNTLFTIGPDNAGEIVESAKDLARMGVKHILYNVGLPSPGNQDVGGGAGSIHPQTAASKITEAYLQLKSLGIKVKFNMTIPLCLIETPMLEVMLEDGYISSGAHCHIFYGKGVVFEANGNVLPCTHFVGHPLLNLKTLGIQTAEEFIKLWYSESGLHGTFHEALWKYPHPKCQQDCKYWGECVGGCPFLWVHFDPNQVFGKQGEAQP